MIEASDLFRIGLRWLHAMAGVAWVGGSIFYLMALTPAVEGLGKEAIPPGLMTAIGREFQAVVRIAIPVFIVSGTILTFDRFAQGSITPQYVIVLGCKVALAVWMFWLALRMRERRDKGGRDISTVAAGRLRVWLSPPMQVLGLGIAIYMLAIVLKVMYETALRVTVQP